MMNIQIFEHQKEILWLIRHTLNFSFQSLQRKAEVAQRMNAKMYETQAEYDDSPIDDEET